jgi:hypothetical protein
MKNIVVGTDFGGRSRQAVTMAADIARAMGSVLISHTV